MQEHTVDLVMSRAVDQSPRERGRTIADDVGERVFGRQTIVHADDDEAVPRHRAGQRVVVGRSHDRPGAAVDVDHDPLGSSLGFEHTHRHLPAAMGHSQRGGPQAKRTQRPGDERHEAHDRSQEDDLPTAREVQAG